MIIIMSGIDGTGPADSIEYARDFKFSNVNRLVRGWQSGPSNYQRGPTDAGLQTKSLADNAASFVHHFHIALARQRMGVFLTGYSRGAAAVIDACWTLHRWGVNVDCLLLFDAVDRTHKLCADVDVIPPNVRACYHAVRDPAAVSRAWMGNCGRRHHRRKTAYYEQTFHCTHGGVGGVPWYTGGPTGAIEEEFGFRHPVYDPTVTTTSVTPLMDRMMAQRVRAWAENALHKELSHCLAQSRR